MTTRNVSGLAAGVGLCLLFSVTSIGYAAVAEKVANKKQKTIELSDHKIHHPCARKSAAALNKKASPFFQSIQRYAKKYEVDQDLVKSVITIESCYRQKSLSPKGAQGLMQLIPATAERFGVSNVYDTDQNVRGGTKYLSWLSKRFNGDLQKVLAGYNAGEGRVDRYNGIPPFRETRNYVHDVLVVYHKFKGQKQQGAQTTVAQTKATKAAQQKARQHQAKLALAYKKQRLARQQKAKLAEQKRLAALTPARRKRAERQSQLAQKIRQRQQPDRQQQLVARMRQRQQAARQKQLIQQVRQQEKRRAALSGKQTSQVHEIITGQMSSPIKVQPQSPKPQAPVLKQVSRKIVRNADGTTVKPQNSGKRVQRTYTSPFKPGRAGREANKRLAPQLYKKQ